MGKKLRKLGNDVGRVVPKEGPFIAYSVSASGEYHGHDQKPLYRLFIKHRNPDDIVRKFQKQFIEHEYSAAFEVNKRLEGHIGGTVNHYLVVDFLVSRVPDKLDWDWTNMSVVEDRNLFDKDHEWKPVKKYVEDFVNQ